MTVGELGPNNEVSPVCVKKPSSGKITNIDRILSVEIEKKKKKNAFPMSPGEQTRILKILHARSSIYCRKYIILKSHGTREATTIDMAPITPKSRHAPSHTRTHPQRPTPTNSDHSSPRRGGRALRSSSGVSRPRAKRSGVSVLLSIPQPILLTGKTFVRETREQEHAQKAKTYERRRRRPRRRRSATRDETPPAATFAAGSTARSTGRVFRHQPCTSCHGRPIRRSCRHAVHSERFPRAQHMLPLVTDASSRSSASSTGERPVVTDASSRPSASLQPCHRATMAGRGDADGLLGAAVTTDSSPQSGEPFEGHGGSAPSAQQSARPVYEAGRGRRYAGTRLLLEHTPVDLRTPAVCASYKYHAFCFRTTLPAVLFLLVSKHFRYHTCTTAT